MHAGLDEATLDRLNEQIVVELQEQGIAVLSGTTIRGEYVLRAMMTNHRTRREDLDMLAREVARVGKELR